MGQGKVRNGWVDGQTDREVVEAGFGPGLVGPDSGCLELCQ